MGNNKRGFASILACLAAILAVAAMVLYRNVMYKLTPVYILLGAAAAVGVIAFLLAGKMPRLAGYLPICIAALMASAAVWGANLMVNQIGYVYSGLDGMDTIMPWIIFEAVTVAGMLAGIIAAFLPMAKAA